MPLTYSRYLKLDELLRLQERLSDGPEHDEMLFIIIHQVYELWFKEILHELDYLQERLNDQNTAGALSTFKRILTILKVMVAQIDILETMTPLEFFSFRERLESSSGFQSYQFRAVEFTLGRKDRKTVDHFPEGSAGRELLEDRYRKPHLWQSFLSYLSEAGHEIPSALLDQEPPAPVNPSPEVQRVLIDLYRSDATRAALCERFVDLDEGFQEWRYRHVKMVERTIGNKTGTGGSNGAAYLRGTLFQPAFPDLWAIRTDL